MSSSSSGIGVGSRVAAACLLMSALVFCKSVAREVEAKDIGFQNLSDPIFFLLEYLD